jgi:hypothetical protein
MTTLANEISVVRLLPSRRHQLYHPGSGLWPKPERQDDPPGVAMRGDHLMIIWSGPLGYGEQFGGPDGEARVLQLPVVGFSR